MCKPLHICGLLRSDLFEFLLDDHAVVAAQIAGVMARNRELCLLESDRCGFSCRPVQARPLRHQ
jgi:translation initiation factor IF-1